MHELCSCYFSDTILIIDASLKNENDENQQTMNQISSPSSVQFQQLSHSIEYKVIADQPSPKDHDVLETETRGVDFKGNVRYFCPRCNVRYIEFKYLKTHLKECGNIFDCPECHQKFKQKRTYVAHMKKKHSIL